MAYSTLTDIKELLPEETLIQLTDDDGLGSVDQTRIDKAIAQADADINAYCGKLYTIPFSTVPEIINKLSVDIAIYHLYSRKDVMPEIRGERYKDAMKQLSDISKGIISLGVDPAPASTGGGVNTRMESNNRIFSRETMEGF